MTTTTDAERAEGTLRERKKSQTRHAIHAAAVRLVDEQGLEQATVEQICRDADISSRTFFNYFPSKAAAALGLPDTMIDEAAAAGFRAADGLLVDALCDVFAATADVQAERVRMKELISRCPELMPALTQWMAGMREQVLALAEERAADAREAQLAMTLVMAAFSSIVHDREADDGRPMAERLRERVRDLMTVRAAKLH
ncbi:TetR family transcriptional regulator [Pseudolysinimonas kribbensis]|uniref:TetR family transcriptional regulator n=1 Tax=Pseudolysinimonas kribbensis TaxID=433641 RepID=A0ABQ6KCH9_9MICO|nr:TetR family transcriptional regulator [Pseudolysinimonas kribbensis]GMA96186.1 TetR family transcriptional regulator [Pseudolysinimonas kribbensis]